MSIVMSGSNLAVGLKELFEDAILDFDDDSILVQTASVREICSHLKDSPEYNCVLLNAITAVDYVEYFELIYQMTSILKNTTYILKSQVYSREDPTVPSVVPVWKGADLQEREIFDLMGISFTDHPDLRRILLWEGFQGHPLRRDYLEPPLPYTWPHGG